MPFDVAIVGSGPTGLYALAALLAAPRPPAIVMFEAQAEAGWGSPYSPGINDRALLANIASVEIPPVTETLAAWLSRQDDAELSRLGVAREQVGERTFFPRLVLGEFFRAQLLRLQERANGRLEVLASHEVADVRPEGTGFALEVDGPDGRARFAAAHLVIATGHSWPAPDAGHPGVFASPYPSSALRGIGPVSLGIRGASLSAIDALVTVAVRHGAFLRDAAGVLQYHARADAEGFRATLMSRKGLLPEADFYFPIPYGPSVHLTPEAVEALVAQGRADLLDATFELFRAELLAADPDYAAEIGLAGLDVESFARAYFGLREGRDPFAWAAEDLGRARASYEAERPLPARYAILRAHEVVEPIVPHLSAEDRERFRPWREAFVDCYATVPHESVERLLAMRRAGRLDVVRLGAEHRVEPAADGPGVVVTYEGGRLRFPAYVDATGQRPLDAPDLPFPSLLASGAVRPAREGGVRPTWDGEGREEAGGVDLDESFRARGGGGVVRELYCLGLPFLLSRLPFSQGLTTAREIADAAAAAILAARAPDSLGGLGGGGPVPEALAAAVARAAPAR